MAQTELITNRIKNRKHLIDSGINSKIRELQRKLVALSFTKESNTTEYFKTLGQIKDLRQSITNGAKS